MDGGQRPVDTSKLHEIPLVQPLELPTDDAEVALLAYVRNTPASNLDASLTQLERNSVAVQRERCARGVAAGSVRGFDLGHTSVRSRALHGSHRSCFW
jgi:hypothetical protein